MESLLPMNTWTTVLWGVGVISTAAVSHFVKKKEHVESSPARKYFLFDEAFIVVKRFFEKASLHTVEEAQTFGNNFVPSPHWVRVVRVVVPAPTLREAADVINTTLPEDELNNVIGGKEWWQRTAHKSGGVDGEWISMKRDWEGLDAEGTNDEQRDEKINKMKGEARADEDRRRKLGRERSGGDVREEDLYSPEIDDLRCILYIHGGAYFFGSINTHRYSIWRFARKTGGRAFAINYRLAPQYPFPCALQDALASYLYLIRPPPGAKHKAVDPAKITIAGDSAGGGLSLALLCLIRDSGLPAPAGGVLISPWCDLSHSCPSILQNTASDIIPPYGFLFKPSTLWPPPEDAFRERADKSTSLSGLKEASARIHEKARGSGRGHERHGIHRANKKGRQLADEVEKLPESDPQRAEGKMKEMGEHQSKGEPSKKIRLKIDGEEVELVDQIQLYATNEQLVYPFVSPAWMPSLGGLPPLYIMCGDSEVLRDEIIYMAHRAAHPDRYPVRKALLEYNPDRTAQQSKYPPTKVHLQVYDGICHDLPLFSFTIPAKYCYRAISAFIKFVTPTSEEKDKHGQPVVEHASPVSRTDMELPAETEPGHPDATAHHERHAETERSIRPNGLHPQPGNATPTTTGSITGEDSTLVEDNSSAPIANKPPKQLSGLEKTIYSSTQPFNRPDYVDNMIRERISLTGVVRPLESEKEIAVLKVDPEELGLIKEGPAKRYLAGKAIWDRKFRKTAGRVHNSREKHLKKSMREEAERITARVKSAKAKQEKPSAVAHSSAVTDERPTESPEPYEQDVHGIWDLRGERPPPSSIAARKDTAEARALARHLEEHYSQIGSLNLISQLHRITTRTAPPRGDSTAVESGSA